ncbi:aminotransferase class V-fold PLP-dependent enzyme [Daejeonella sp.]|uniref:aminotransferase class V-fold PLP-dependent enzyme n=1 Tax=Daejeonella sp. TaxID=2805397 RepID=UPI0026B9F97D|nr:aminotransferase class V-fold PLP-dependent enzyme [Daejeonella sp.]HQS04363.1 aminotransferase class V-fold PLP-dependent enzyme [Daejeonella sp.]HQT23071.1 aminotransferase class V-fold PLP-dependent enzyme [Daejeonella sp.]HQT57957.1 aminotransferase class V-fold PLP-dependent enzyme [Daejeonella sp.]
MKRREILKSLTLLPLAGGITATAAPLNNMLSAPAAGRDLFKELGIRTFINAAGNYTVMSGCLMPPEVMEAINGASKKFALVDDVQEKVGERIAQMCHAEAALVSAGCWSALMLGMAGVLTGMDSKRVSQVPNLAGTGMKSEVILQKSHSMGYDHALTQAGVKLIKVETRAEVEAAINENTAMLWFLNREVHVGQIKHAEWLELGKKYNLPTMIDIAADVPPVENLWKFNDMGFDLVVISGGKAMRGPQSAGILMGKKKYVDAARLSNNPRGGIGRGQKVNKEEVFGMYAALERFINLDHKKEWEMWERKIAYIAGVIKSIPGVTTGTHIPATEDNKMPTLKVTWDPNKIKLTNVEMGERLRKGNPSVEVISWEAPNTLRCGMHVLEAGEERIVASRLKEELLKASV